MKIPENLLFLATHGSHTAPEVLKPYIDRDFDERLQRNYSDFATTDLIRGIPEAQRRIPVHGRIAGDTNRAWVPEALSSKTDAEAVFRKTDFGGLPVYNNPLPENVRNAALAESYHPYHAEIVRILMAQHGDIRDTLLTIDLHDTGNLLLGHTPEEDKDRGTTGNGWRMPPVIISDQDGLTTPDGLMTDLQNAFVLHLGLSPEDVILNNPYKGGYVTKHYGDPNNPKLKRAKHKKRAVVQVELYRGLYVDERTQQINPHAIEHYRERLARACAEVADGRTYHASAR